MCFRAVARWVLISHSDILRFSLAGVVSAFPPAFEGQLSLRRSLTDQPFSADRSVRPQPGWHVSCIEIPVSNQRKQVKTMSDFNANFDEDQDQVLLATTEDANLNSLLSDEVVMQWLMDLDEHSSTAAADTDSEFTVRRMHA